MKSLSVTTKAGSSAFGINLEYGLDAPQYSGLDEIADESPDGARFEDIALVNLNATLKAHSTQGNKGGVRDALEDYLKGLSDDEVTVLQGMSIGDASSILLENEAIAAAIASHQEKCSTTRLSASVQRGRADGLTQTEVNKLFAAESRHMTREQIEEAIGNMRTQRGVED